MRYPFFSSGLLSAAHLLNMTSQNRDARTFAFFVHVGITLRAGLVLNVLRRPLFPAASRRFLFFLDSLPIL